MDCIVGAVSKMQRPAADKRRKNYRRDAMFLARQLAARNIAEVFVPDDETESLRNLSPVREDIAKDLTRAKQRLTRLLITHGHVYNEVNERGKRRGTWTRAYWERTRSIDLSEPAAQESLDYYVAAVRHLETQTQLAALKYSAVKPCSQHRRP